MYPNRKLTIYIWEAIMIFNKIDLENWNRKETYTYYLKSVPCTYSMTLNLDITEFLHSMKVKNIKVFPALLYAISHTVNKYKEFRMDLDEHNNIGYYEISNPCFTVFHDETESFTNVWTEYSSDYLEFIRNYTNDMNHYQADSINSKPLVDTNTFNVSCIPWTNFTGFNLNLQKGYDYLAPIFTIGKYFSHGEKTLVPLAVQVHHAVCDGFHLSRFLNELQDFITLLAKEHP